MRPPTDAFPATAATWLGRQVRQGDVAARQRARSHVMSVYYHPLIVYIKGSSFRSLGEAEDLVAGFLADRLERDDYLEKWLESGLPLRVWLIRGLKYSCMERMRAMRRDGTAEVPEELRDEAASAPGSEYHRHVARNLVREAMGLARAELEEKGLAEHWSVFCLHHLEGMSYAHVAKAMGLSEERAGVMGRTAGRRLRARIRELCAWPGATDAEIDRDILSMFE